MTAEDLITESVMQNRIVTVPYTRQIDEDLSGLCDDGAEGSQVHEYWGTDEWSNDWRVHLEVSR